MRHFLIMSLIIFCCIGWSLSVVAATDELITGGCKAQMGELSKEEEEKIGEIGELIDTEQDLKMLTELYNFLQSNSGNKHQARPLIQKILLSISSRHTIQIETELTDEHAKPIVALLDYYTEDDMYPEFSYEAAICREISVIFSFPKRRQMLAELVKKAEQPNLSVEQKFQLMTEGLEKVIKLGQVLTYQMLDYTLKEFEEHPLDVCARKQLWEFSERLIGGGPYFEKPGDGIEVNEEFVNRLKAAYNEEQNQVICKIAERVLLKIETVRKEQ